jgi:hypothetical protein
MVDTFPTNQLTEWSCGIACVEWFFRERHQQNNFPDQAGIINKFKANFPEWEKRPGLCSPADLLKLLELVGVKMRRCFRTNKLNEVELFLMGEHAMVLILTRKPTRHCMVLAKIDPKAVVLTVMSPAIPISQFHKFSPRELIEVHDADFLFVYQSAEA